MPRSHAEIAADLDKIRSTLRGLRAGFTIQRPILELKLGAPLAAGISTVVAKVLDVHDALALVLEELHQEIREVDRDQTALVLVVNQLSKNQDKIVDGIGETARVLA